jgi:hypothetical protein
MRRGRKEGEQVISRLLLLLLLLLQKDAAFDVRVVSAET